MSSRRSLLLLLLVMAAGFTLSGRMHATLLEQRRAYHLTQADPLENSPPLVAFTTVALGGFRGVLTDMLWLRITRLQEEGRYFEIVQLADWITKLEPQFASVWGFHAWNMAYNISVLVYNPADRWRWVRHGIELLRDEGLHYNPGSAKLYWELGWLYQHKLGANFDDAHLYYKRAWAKEMTGVLGGAGPDYQRLAAVPRTPHDLVQDVQVAALVARLRQQDLDPLDPATLEDPRARELIKDDPGADVLEGFLQLRRMVDTYKLRPEIMADIDRTYGALDWRLPAAHGIYWAWRGRERASGFDLVSLDRMLYQCLTDLVLEGTLHIDLENDTYELSPNLALAESALAALDAASAAHPEFESMLDARWALLGMLTWLHEEQGLHEAAARFRAQRDAMPPPKSWETGPPEAQGHEGHGH
jgi:hypothetical protein